MFSFGRIILPSKKKKSGCFQHCSDLTFISLVFSRATKLIIFIETRRSDMHSSSHRSIKRSVVACIYNTRPLTKYVFDRLFRLTSYIRLYSKLSQRSACIYSTRPPTKPFSCLTFFFFEGYPILFRPYLCRWCPETVDIPSAKLEASDKTSRPWPRGLFVAGW